MWYRSAWVDGQNVVKSNIRDGYRDFAVWAGTITQLRAATMAAHKNVIVVDGSGLAQPYYLDAADTTTADNGTTVIVSADGGRYRLARPAVTAAQVEDFSEAVQGVMASVLVAGTNITITYDEAEDTFTFAAAGGGAGTNLAFTRDVTTLTVTSDTGNNAVLPKATNALAGLARKATTAEVLQAVADAYLTGDHLAAALAPVTLTYATSQPVDFKGGFNQRVVLTGATTTLQLPTNPVPGRWINLDVIQDAAGSRVLGFATGYQFPNKTAPTITAAANAKTKLSIYCEDASNFIVIANLNIGAPA